MGAGDMSDESPAGDRRLPMTERSGAAARSAPSRRGRIGRGGWLVVGLLGVLGKTQGISAITHHPRSLAAGLSVLLVISIVRLRPPAVAFCGAGVLAFAVGLQPLPVAIASGVGAYMLLMALFIAIGSALRARQR